MAKFTYTIRKDGRLVKKVVVNGKPQFLYARTKEELQKKYAEVQYLKSINKAVANGTITFKEYSKIWIELNSVGKTEPTIQNITRRINNHIIPYIGYMQMRSIKQDNIKKVIAECSEFPDTSNRVLIIMKRIFEDAINNDMIARNPCNGITKIKTVKKEKKILSPEEDKILLESTSKYAPFFIVMRYTGMRREEIIPLTVQDVDFSNNLIHINKAVSLNHNQPVLKTTKNKKSRTVPILDVIKPLLEQVVEEAKTRQNHLLFVKETDNAMLSQTSVRRHLEAFCNQTGIKFTCHQLRHSYCTMLYYSGIGIKKTQQLMGHSSAKLVYDLYAHLDEKQENEKSKLDKFLKNKKKVVRKVVKKKEQV